MAGVNNKTKYDLQFLRQMSEDVLYLFEFLHL